MILLSIEMVTDHIRIEQGVVFILAPAMEILVSASKTLTIAPSLDRNISQSAKYVITLSIRTGRVFAL